jgi:hypothetical protein
MIASHVGDLRRRREPGGDEALIGIPVGRHDLEQEVGLARQHVTLADLGPAADQILEGAEIGLGLAFKPDMGEHGDTKTELFRRQLSMESANEAGLLQSPHPPEAGRRRNPHPVGKFHIRHAPMILQVAQNERIDAIEFGTAHSQPLRPGVRMHHLLQK